MYVYTKQLKSVEEAPRWVQNTILWRWNKQDTEWMTKKERLIKYEELQMQSHTHSYIY